MIITCLAGDLYDILPIRQVIFMIYYMFDRWSLWSVTCLTGGLYDLVPVWPAISMIYYQFDRWPLWSSTCLTEALMHVLTITENTEQNINSDLIQTFKFNMFLNW